ncbi:MAG TPA: hypothetical protein VK894_04505, partial [Jiangellales bacterium]|nr:hypothetical protein [Jiangellales bacterium]
ADLHGRLVQARELRAEWSARARDGKPPRVGSHHADARAASADTTDDLEALAATNPRTAGLAELPWAEAHRRLGVLAADERTLLTVPRLRELEASLSAAGLGALVEELRGRRPDTATAVATLDHAWHASLVDLWREEDPSYGAVEAQSLDAEVAAFGEADLRLQAAAVATVHRVHEAAVASAVEQNPGQAALVAAQTAVTTQVRGTPDLVRAAPELILALKPCWVVSPYAVADLLPPQRLFDVVVVAGAGALRPAEAVPALLRGEHVVLCGGAHEQVPPPYSVPVEQEPVDDDAPARAPEESLLEVLGPSLPVHELSWQHAARDERLVAFANSSVHAGRLVTTPAASVDASAVRHVLVAGRTSGDDPVDSAGAEVQRVVELVLDHARTRPYESLAVVTLGPDHARRVAAAVRAALSREPDLDAFFTEDGDEPFVVTHLGRPPVGARDAVVLTLGYGRTVDGRVLYRFGPLAHPGGDVRLAAVLARARMRFTLVSSFSSADLNERRLTSEGPRVLRDLLAYVERGARDGTGVGSDVADPLEDAVRTRLAAAGITPVTHVGTSSRRVGLALPHPVRPRRFVLAVDTDGPAWAAAGSVRESVRIVPEELERRGWRTHRVWSAAWAADPDGETRRLLEAYERAVEAADGYDAAVAAAVNDAVVGLPDAAVESARAQGTVRSPRPRGARPPVRPGRDASGYSLVELVALARWVESDAGLRTEGEAADELARELDLVPAGARVDALLRHAVRAGRAAGGGPDRLDLPAVDGSVRSEGPPEAGTPADGGTSPEDETPSEAEQSSDSAKPSDAEPPADAWEPGPEVEAQVTGPEQPPEPDQSTAEEEQSPDADMGTPPGPDPSEPIRGNEPR